MRVLWAVVLVVATGAFAAAPDAGEAPARSGECLAVPSPLGTVWWAPSSAAKVRPDALPPEARGEAVRVRLARRETEAAPLVLRPEAPVHGLRITAPALAGPGGARLGDDHVEVLRVGTVLIEHPTDAAGAPGPWPDPLLPLTEPVDLPADRAQAFWIRVTAPAGQPAGTYRGAIRLAAVGATATVPLEVTVWDFDLPAETTLTTAFGFSAAEVFRYQRLATEADRRKVLDLYLEDFAKHRVSPYDPAPLDPFRVTWPKVRPPHAPADDWENLRIVGNEVHAGEGACVLFDDRPDENVTLGYGPFVAIPPRGFVVRLWFRTALPHQTIQFSCNHYDADHHWLSGKNLDLKLAGTGRWQSWEGRIDAFPPAARFVRFFARPTPWTEHGEGIGLAWLDDVSVEDAATGEELVAGGDFEPVRRTEPVASPDALRVVFDFDAWDRAMAKAIDQDHFNSFRVPVPGLGGGSFFDAVEPNLLGFGPDTPEYPLLLGSYAKGLQDHLAQRGWLDRAYVYFFDEPGPEQYDVVRERFGRLQAAAPGLARMLTEQVEPGLVGAPDIWCCLTPEYDADRIEARRATGERFWWYVCTAPKAPYAGLFIDHAAPEMRLWAWQTWQRRLDGLLVWQTNYWNSTAAYPDPRHPQDPYEDPMSWTSGYGAAPGEHHPWGNGDGRFLYPPPACFDPAHEGPVLEGPVDSIRWEHLRDGIEDHEYLAMLRRRLDAARARGDTAAAERYAPLLSVPAAISESLTAFAPDGRAIEHRREQVAQAILALGR